MLRAKDTFRKMYSAAKGYYCGGLAVPNAFSALDLRHSLNSSRKPPGHANPFRVRSYAHSALGGDSADQEVVIALGSNVGDRVSTFNRALRLMRNSGIKIIRHACLYETAPAYVTGQPRFLNSAVRGTTKLGPHDLLKKLKEIEKDIGRTAGIRYGPRPIDLDILLYGDSLIKTETLIVPHERIRERPFVLAPLVDLLGSSSDGGMEKSWHSLSKCNGGFFDLWNKLGGESVIGTEGIKRVMPVGNTLLDWRERTLVMGVLNLTPDSFSDGGKFQKVDAAISQAKLLILEGADIIDIGAQSTRPFARRLSANEELERLVPVLDAITKIPEMEGKLLSVDTFYGQVAAEAVKRGATMINDVSGGQLDPNILEVVAKLGVPYVTMHMRGYVGSLGDKPRVEIKGRFSVTSENVDLAKVQEIPVVKISPRPQEGSALRKSASVGAWPMKAKPVSNNHQRNEFCDSSVSASVLIPHLQNLVQQTTFQQDLITKLMSNLQQNEKADGLMSSVQTVEGGTRVETGSAEGERILLAKIFELQSRMISLTDELITSKLKHVQLQDELNALYSQEEIIDTREEDNEEA